MDIKLNGVFSQVVAPINGTVIPIVRPKDSSIIVQGTVHYRGMFLDVYIGWPGKVHDAQVFTNSSL